MGIKFSKQKNVSVSAPAPLRRQEQKADDVEEVEAVEIVRPTPSPPQQEKTPSPPLRESVKQDLNEQLIEYCREHDIGVIEFIEAHPDLSDLADHYAAVHGFADYFYERAP